jgi:hypothetical protein
MKKCIFLSTLFLLASALSFSQSEIKFSLGTSNSNSSEFSDLISEISFEDTDVYTYTVTEQSSAPRIGADISLSYSYYFKHNIKTFCSLSYQQIGYSSQIDYDLAYNDIIYSDYDYDFSSSSTFDYDYLRTALGATYITDFGMTISLGIVGYSELSSIHTWEYSAFYPNLPSSSNSVVEQDTNITDGYTLYGPMLGLGYELGNFSIDLNYSSIDDVYNDSDFTFNTGQFSSVSISAGYSMLLIK